MKKCYLYVRVSSDSQVGGSGIERQKNLLLKYVEDNALQQKLDPSFELLVDEGRSAFKSEHLSEHAALGRFFRHIAEGKIAKGSCLVLESLDRFSRENPFRCVEYLSQLDRAGIELHDVEKRLIISRRHSNSLTFATMIAERAYEESKLKSTRIAKGWAKRRSDSLKNGTYMIKNCPTWISVVEDRYVLNDNAKIIREIFDLYLNNIRSSKIAKILNESNKLINGLKWTGTKVCRVLRNVRAKGDYISNIIERDFDYDTSKVTTQVMKIYPPVVSDEEFKAASVLLSEFNYTGRIRKDQKKTLFNSILKCSLCGAAMTISTTGKYTYLKCSTARDKNDCESVMMPYPAFEKALLKHLKDISVIDVLKNKSGGDEVGALKTEIAQMSNYVDSYNDGILKIKSQGRMPSFEMLDQKAIAEENLEELKNKLSSLEVIKPTENIQYSDAVHDVNNIVERSKIENEVRRILKKVNITSTSKMKNYIVVDIEYYNDDLIKHCLVLEKKTGLCIASGEIINDDGWRKYTISEESRIVFQVESNDDVWTISASKNKNIEDIRNYMRIMIGRENDGFDFTINEELIDWID